MITEDERPNVCLETRINGLLEADETTLLISRPARSPVALRGCVPVPVPFPFPIPVPVPGAIGLERHGWKVTGRTDSVPVIGAAFVSLAQRCLAPIIMDGVLQIEDRALSSAAYPRRRCRSSPAQVGMAGCKAGCATRRTANGKRRDCC